MVTCTYCGDWYECSDHIRPVHYDSVSRSIAHGKTVPCCNLCNSLASDFVAQNPNEKAIYLIRRYEIKYRKILALPPWSQADVERAQLRGYLKRRITSNEKLRRLIMQKIFNLELVTNGFKPVPIERQIVL